MDTTKLEISGEPIPAGRRRDTIYNLGLSLRRQGRDASSIYEILFRLNRPRCPRVRLRIAPGENPVFRFTNLTLLDDP